MLQPMGSQGRIRLSWLIHQCWCLLTTVPVITHSDAQRNDAQESHPGSLSWFLDTAHQLSARPSWASPGF